MMRTMRHVSARSLLLGLAVMLGASAAVSEAAEPAGNPSAVALAREIFDATGVRGGLIVHVGCGDGSLTAALRASDSHLVLGLDTDPAAVRKARTHIRSQGLDGGQGSVACFDGKYLPLIDNLVNLVVAEDLGGVHMDEAMRVLAPNGAAYVKRKGK